MGNRCFQLTLASVVKVNMVYGTCGADLDRF